MSRRVKTLQDVVDWGLCTGCGACVAATDCAGRPGAVAMIDVKDAGLRPVFIDPTALEAAGLAFCPGLRVDGNQVTDTITHRGGANDSGGFGQTLEIWEGHATDPEIRHQASSGGILSALALYCLEHEQMEFVLHAGTDEQEPWRCRTVRSQTREEILARAGSRYAPASPCERLADIEAATRPCVFIGKPCDTAAAMQLTAHRPGLERQLGLVLAFFCAGTPNTSATLGLLGELGIDPVKVHTLRYRGEGWPGGFKVGLNGDGSGQFIPYEEAWGRLARNRPFRCYLCPDGLGRLADIACGDAWHRRHDNSSGNSLVLVRTERGRRILHAAMAAGYVQLRPAGVAEVMTAQSSLLARRRRIFGRLLTMRLLGVPAPQFPGFNLGRDWLALPLGEQVRSILGTARRIIRRGLWHRQPPLPLPPTPVSAPPHPELAGKV